MDKKSKSRKVPEKSKDSTSSSKDGEPPPPRHHHHHHHHQNHPSLSGSLPQSQQHHHHRHHPKGHDYQDDSTELEEPILELPSGGPRDSSRRGSKGFVNQLRMSSPEKAEVLNAHPSTVLEPSSESSSVPLEVVQNLEADDDYNKCTPSADNSIPGWNIFRTKKLTKKRHESKSRRSEKQETSNACRSDDGLEQQVEVLNAHPPAVKAGGMRIVQNKTHLSQKKTDTTVPNTEKKSAPRVSTGVSPRPSISLCPCGNRDLDDVEKGIFCDGCHTWLHGRCTSLSDKEITALGSSDDLWLCNTCVQPSQSLNSTSSQSDLVTCQICKHLYKRRGIKTHWTRAHPEIPFVNPLESVKEKPTTESLEVRLATYKQTQRVLKRIPKGARVTAASKLISIIDRCVQNNDTDAWKDLLIFSYAALRVPEKSNKSLASLVKKNINSFSIDEVNPASQSQNHVSTTLSRRIESKISEGDVRGAVKILASDDTLAEMNESTLSSLREKHPAPSRSLILPDPPDTADQTFLTTAEDIKLAIFSFPNGSAGGIDGLRPQHLKDLVAPSNGEVGEKLVHSITSLCNLMFSGKLCQEICKIFYGASLCALKKKSGGIRPIAIGCTLRRLAAKIACKFVGEEVGSYLRPLQVGVNTRGGCEAAIHSTRTFINDNEGSDYVLLKIDCKNAFNSIERDIMLTRVKEIVPPIYNFLWQCYSTPSSLYFGPEVISSEVGCQQGDPIGPLVFSLTIHPVVKDLQSNLNIWYLDDGTLAGPPETVLEDFITLAERFKDLGLQINPSKCELYFLSDEKEEVSAQFNSVSPGIKIVKDDLELLGAPLIASAIPHCFNKKTCEIRRLLERVKELSRHIAYYLIKHCLAIPKLIYFLRTTPLWNFEDEVKGVDQMIKSTLEEILNCHLEDSKWTLASLPVSLGGIGIRKIENLTLPAFLSSSFSVLDLVKLILPSSDNVQIADLGNAINRWESMGLSIPPVPGRQKNWDNIMVNLILSESILEDPLDKARFLASSRPESSGWLQVLPSRCLGTLLDNNSFRISMAIRLGLNICRPHTCVCGADVLEDGRHGLCCPKSAGRFPRHQELNNLICRALQTAKLPSVLEPTGLSRDDGKRLDGMTLVPWQKGQMLIWDSTCVDTLAPSYVNISSTLAGSAAEKAALKKRNKYQKLIDQNFIFVPFAVETLGSWGSEAIKFVEDIGNIINLVTCENKSKLYLKQRISLAIQRGNAASVIGTFNQNYILN